ncbi:stalk domain-containing protein [Paenibacillus aurantius]|uniref:Stalk domain-containing protein n=1 Tax=Paenibacillus aurantius TaxID=2918900 RepID=A0AA96RDN6_9BACL|nr:stalk domain-containing protein [Paenibacillus aurantius]WNQ11590.1 stalk domain-containing protein [Paenibacillus aurantius]
MFPQAATKTAPKTPRRIKIALALALVLQTFAWVPVNVMAAEPAVVYQGEDIITSGAILKKYDFSTVRSGSTIHTDIKVIEVALNNPLVKLDVMTGKNNQFTKKQSVSGMATETGAVAGVNGDFFNTQAEGTPEGPQISNGELMATPPFLPGLYSFAVTKDNKPIIDLFTFTGSVKAPDGASYALGGINKTYYWFEPSGQHSMIDGLFMYTDAWGQIDRSNDGVTSPTEVLVQNGIVKEIAPDRVIQMIPPSDGYILRASGKAAEFITGHFKVGDKINADYSIIAQDPTKTYNYKDFKTMIGGHTILVDGGKPAAFSRELDGLGGYRARTALGYSQDGKYAYLFTAENSGDSKGLSMTELQQAMVKVGIWKGLLLDGGGSTQMVSRPLGETGVKLVTETENAPTYQRPVVNAVGVWTTAPKGPALAVNIEGEKNLLIGEKAPYQIKGYDIYYNPLPIGQAAAQWSSTSGTFNGNVFTPTAKGPATITAVSGQAKQTLNVNVLGRTDLESLRIQASNTILTQGADIKLSLVARLKNGQERTLSGDAFQWEVKGFKGEVQGDTLHVGDLTGTTSGQLIAKYDGFSANLAMAIGSTQVWADFDQTSQPVSYLGSSADVKGTVSIVPGLSGLPATNKALQLTYDMTAGTGTKAAYVKFGDNGLPVSGNPQSLKLNVLGDKSLNWLRAEITDAAGTSKLVDLTRAIDWTGWKPVSADLTAYNFTYPIKVKRIYVANPAQGQDERAATGTVGFDDISFQYKTAAPVLPLNQIKLQINNPNVTVNGKTLGLAPSPAPYLTAGNTMVPLRFVTEALGGEVKWDNDNRKVIVTRGGKLLELWIDQVNLNVNGKYVTAEVPPVLKNEVTMVPLRILSENLGWKVSWDQATYTVTME